MEMLDPPVVAAALSLVLHSLEGGALDPPDLPYSLLGTLVRAVPVLESLRTGMETSKSKLEKSSMKKAGWTISPGSGSGNGGSPASVTLQPINSSYTPLGTLAEDVLHAAMKAVLRVLRNSSGGGNSSLDVLVQPLFSIIFELAGVCGLDWLWVFYQTHLCTFIADVDKLSSSVAVPSKACAAAFQQYWASLPWNQQAAFHLDSPLAIAKIRAYVPSADYAAARLVHDLDWTPILTALLPPTPTAVSGGSGGGGGSGRSTAVAGVGSISSGSAGVFTLLDETEDDNALITSALTSPTHQQQSTDNSVALSHHPREIDLVRYSRKQWAAEVGLLLLHCSIFLPDSPIGIPEWSQKILLGRTAAGEDEAEAEDVAIIRLLAASDWHLIESTLTRTTSTTSNKVPWLVLPMVLAPGSIYGDVGDRVVHAGYVLSRAAEKEGSATAARVVVNAVHPLLAFSICQGVQISMGQQMQSLSLGGGAGNRAVEDAATAAALAASIASHQLVDIPDDIPEELLEGTVELEQLRLQREQIRIAQEEAAAAAVVGATAASSQNAGATSSGPAVPLIEVSGCFRFTPAQHVTLLRDVLGPLAAKHAQHVNISTITAEQCAPEKREEVKSSKKDEEQPAAAVAAMLCVSLLQPLVLDPVTLLTQDTLSYTNSELPWVMENTSKAVFISNVFGGSGGAGGRHQSGISSQRPGRSMRALRQQISSLLRLREGASPSSLSNQDPFSSSSSSFTEDDRDMALNQAVTDALSLRNLMGHVIEDAAVRAVYSVQHDKRLGACLLRCILLTPSVYYSAFIAHVGENILRGLASPTPHGNSTSVHTGDSSVGVRGGYNNGFEEQVHASEEIPVIEAAGEDTKGVAASKNTAAATASLDVGSSASTVSVPKSMHFAAVATSNLDPTYLLEYAQAAARMRRPLLTAYALASARHAATLLDKTTWQGLVIEALKVVQQSESNAEHPLDVVAPWLESLNWIADTRWRRLPSGPHKAALNDLLASLDNRVQVIEVLTPEELDAGEGGGLLRQQQQQQQQRNPLSGVVSAASAAAGRFRQHLGQSSATGIDTQTDAISHTEHTVPVAASPGGLPGSIEEFPEGPLEDPSLGKKLASGFRNFGKSVSQASTKLKNKLADGEKTGVGSSLSSIYPSTATTTILPAPPSSQVHSTATGASSSIEPERDHLVRVALAAYAITSYIRSVMDPKLTRRTISGAEASSPKHLRGPSSTFSAVHIRGNSSLTGSRHLEEAQISELDTVLEAREAVDYLLQLEASPLLAQHRHVYAGFLDGVPQLLTARTGVETFAVAVVRLLVPNEDEAGQVVVVLTHTGA